MNKTNCSRRRRAAQESGATLVLVAIALVMMLGLAALSIDVAVLYATRMEAQKAADAAALAGAKQYVTSGYTVGQMGEEVCPLAQADAAVVAATNTVGGSPAVVSTSSCDFSIAGDPRFTAKVVRTGLPLLFGRVWGRGSNVVAASATAEAYNSSGNGPPVQTACVKPWVIPNCDEKHANPRNPNCATGARFLNDDGSIANPGRYEQGGIVGETITLKPGRPSDAAAPSQFYAVSLPDTSAPLCPSCARGGGGGASDYRQDIECCNQSLLQCGRTNAVDLTLDTGNMKGPTSQGVQCLIHQNKGGSGQDILDTSADPFRFLAGGNNPLVPGVVPSGSVISTSDSVVTLPVYDGHQLCPGGSCSSDVQIIGFLQAFINSVDSDGTVHATILNIAGCTAGSGGSGAISGGGVSPIPVRLVQPGGGS